MQQPSRKGALGRVDTSLGQEVAPPPPNSMSQAPNPHQSTTTAPRLAWLLSRDSLTLSQKPLCHSLSPLLVPAFSASASLFSECLPGLCTLLRPSQQGGRVGWPAVLPLLHLPLLSEPGILYMGSADCLTKWRYRLFRLISGFFVSLSLCTCSWVNTKEGSWRP